MNFTGFLTGDMLEVDEFQFSTNDQLLYEVKNKATLPNTCYPALTFPYLAPSTHVHNRINTYTSYDEADTTRLYNNTLTDAEYNRSQDD